MKLQELAVKIEDVRKQLRPYQLEAVDKMRTSGGYLDFDDMGLGKTITSLTAMLSTVQHPDARILVVCSKNALYVWKEEIEKWFGLDCLIYSGTIKQRKIMMDNFWARDCPFLISTYGMTKELYDYKWHGLICDEIHVSGLLNQKTDTFKFVRRLTKNVEVTYLMTGTPIRQGVVDLYAPLHLIAPKKFTNYWSFVNRYCIVTETPFGKQIERNPRNIPTFREMLNTHMVRRLKTEVLKDLPGKQRNPISLAMTPKQAKMHKDIMETLMYVDEEALIVTPNKMTAILRARQLLVSPKLLGVNDTGAALTYLKEAGEALLVAERPFVVFTPFKQALALIKDVVLEIGMNTKIYEICGGLTPAAFAKQWQGFEADTSKNKVLLCVIKSGASFHATTAADCFFLGYEWDFNFNVQSEDRLCRIGQDNFVNCNYLLHEGDTVDEAVKIRLNEKQSAANWIIGTEIQYLEMLNKVKGKNRK